MGNPGPQKTTTISEREYLRDLATLFEIHRRQGEETDTPEGARYIVISDTMAKGITDGLRRAADSLAAAVPNDWD